MTTAFVTKRPHKKSRGGCITCKTKKVKCDEVQPKCTFCDKRNLTCAYPSRTAQPARLTPPNSQSPSSSSRANTPGSDDSVEEITMPWDLISAPPPPIMTLSGSLSNMDVRMMHHWSVMTWNSVTIGDGANSTLLVITPQLAFENEFLLNGLLGIAALHVQHLTPGSDPVRKQIDIYVQKALTGFREALPEIRPGTSQYESAMVMAVLLVLLYSLNSTFEENEIMAVQWLVLYRGLQTIIKLDPVPKDDRLSVYPLFQRELSELKVKPVIPRILLSMVQEIHPLDPEYDQLEYYCNTLDVLGKLFAGLKQDGVGEKLSIRIVSWCSFVSQEFTNLAKEKRPRALIILAYYMMFLKLVKLWWVEGIAERDVVAIAGVVGPTWLPYLKAPLQVIALRDEKEIARLILT